MPPRFETRRRSEFVPRFVALLRGINVGGRNKVPMSDLKDLCSAIGWEDVETHIQSGNVLFTAAEAATDGRVAGHLEPGKTGERLEAELEQAMEQHLGLQVPVIVRSADAWSNYLAANPFPDESATQPNLVMLALSKNRMLPKAAETLQGRATAGEQLKQAAGGLWIYYPNGSGRSKLTPTLLDKGAGSPVTTRNWRTVSKIAELLRPRSG